MKLFFKFMLMMLFITSIQLIAQQQKPEAPIHFKATLQETSTGQAIIFAWETNPNGITPSLYNIYFTDNNANKLINVAQVKHLENQKEYKHFVSTLKPGTYSFTITAVAYINGAAFESDYSEFIKVTFGESRNLFFASNPQTEIKVNDNYIYSMKVNAAMDCPFRFELLSGPEGMKIEDNNLIWLPEKVGDYKVSVKVSYTNCNIEAQDIQNFAIRVFDGNQNELYIKIRMEDVINMKLGTTMTFKLLAETNANCPVIFDFPEGLPEGFKFGGSNANSMLVASPTTPGDHILVIKATLSCDKNFSVMKKVLFRVDGKNQETKHCAWIKGTIKSEDNTPVLDGIVNALRLDRNNKNDQPLFKSKIDNGSFELNVPEGNYALDISGGSFYAEWYEDAEFVTEAKRITVACEETFTANAIVKLLPVPKHFTVKGKVYNKETNEPVFAQVEFINSESMFNNSGTKEKAKFIAKTDDKGNYSINLPDNFSYVALAVSMMNSIQFDIVYYKDAHSPMDAEIIKLTQDIENVDFGLTAVQQINAGFTGRVFNKNDEPLKAKLIAYCIKTQNQYFKEVKTTYITETDENGSYRFDKLIPGDYIVQSIPVSKDYVPGYYNKNDFVVLKWKESAIITVDENMIEMLFDFKHNLRNELGLVQIGGKIVNKGGAIGKKGDGIQVSTPIAGAFVYVVNEDGIVCDYVFSNNEGSFDMKEVAEGSLRIVADKVGMETYEELLETNYNEKSNVQLEVAMEQAVVNVDEAKEEYMFTTYPMPVKNVLNIKFSSEFMYKGEIKIINILGMNLISKAVDIVKGDNTFTMDLSVLPIGSYIIRIKNENTVLQKSIQVIK